MIMLLHQVSQVTKCPHVIQLFNITSLWKILKLLICSPIQGDNSFYTVGWKKRCSEYFPYSTYFEGSQSSVVTKNRVTDNNVNGGMNHLKADQNAAPLSTNGKLENIEALKNLAI